MKYYLFLVATVAAVNKRSVDEYKSPTDGEIMDQLFSKTVFSSDHNKKTDNQFLTKVFRKYSELGADSEGDVNGKRVLTPWTAKYAAKDILKEWKGMSHEDATEFVESEDFQKIFKEFDYQGVGTIDQRDAYFWARKLVGEQYEGPISSEGM